MNLDTDLLRELSDLFVSDLRAWLELTRELLDSILIKSEEKAQRRRRGSVSRVLLFRASRRSQR